MEIRTTLLRGSDHHLTCEDFLWVSDQERYLLFAVMDGCSGGVNSVFASHLLGKVLNSWFGKKGPFFNNVWESAYDATLSMFVMCYHEFGNIKESLRLEISELESTLVLCAIDKTENIFSIQIMGDGFLVVDDEIIDNDQDNIPKYLAHFLDKSIYTAREQCATYNGKFHHNIGISTDGIASFREPDTNSKVDVSKILLCGNWLAQNKECLTRKINTMKSGRSPEFPNVKLYHTDDIAIIRYFKID